MRDNRRSLICGSGYLFGGVGSKHLYFAQFQAETVERGFDCGIGGRAFDIDEEEVISQPLLGGTALDHGQVYVGIVQFRENHQ